MKLGLNPVLEVEASVVNKNGKAGPVAEQVFYVLEQSAIGILDDVTSEIGYARTMNALRSHAARFFITDAEGKARVKQLKEGAYYICGVVYSEQEAMIWNVRIDLVAGPNRLALSSENMMRS